jgi:hypothetical protein
VFFERLCQGNAGEEQYKRAESHVAAALTSLLPMFL